MWVEDGRWPLTGGETMKPTLNVTVTVREDWRGRGVAAAILRWDDSGERRAIVRRVRGAGGVPLTYRALLFALWQARRVGARALVVDPGDPEVAAQITGAESPPDEVLSLYLQVRALLNAFRAVVITRSFGAGPDAAAAAAAVDGAIAPCRPVYADLPLWTATAS
jgi:GNAT superfamily N-acetyltransferase